MALDTTALSPRRRAVMLVVLLALFGASLGAASLLVSWRARTARPAHYPVRIVGFSTEWPQGFVDCDNPTLAEGVTLLETRTGQVNGGSRMIGFLKLPIPGELQGKDALTPIGDFVVAQIVHGAAITRQSAKLGQFPALEWTAQVGPKGLFVRLRATIVEDRFVGILYLGATAWSKEDAIYWDHATGSAFVLLTRSSDGANREPQ